MANLVVRNIVSNEEFLRQAKQDYDELTLRLKQADAKYRDTTRLRDEVIANAHAVLGGTTETTGKFFGISKQRISQILRRWRSR